MSAAENVFPLVIHEPKKPNTPSSVWPFESDTVNPWAYWEDAFSPPECDQLIQIGESLGLNSATVGNVGAVDPNIRVSEVSWIHPNRETEWAFRRLTDIVMSLNSRFFQFDLFGLTEGMQFTRYVAPGGNYGRHIDSMYGTRIRKLSFTLQLSDPEEYEGGDLMLYFSNTPDQMSRKRGAVAVFPSYTLHEVTPVTKGTRYSLVAWVTGRPFK
jgi:PKHD-type hydroxylase